MDFTCFLFLSCDDCPQRIFFKYAIQVKLNYKILFAFFKMYTYKNENCTNPKEFFRATDITFTIIHSVIVTGFFLHLLLQTEHKL